MNIIGKGNSAEVIEYGEGKVCKLFHNGQPDKLIKLEYENSVEIFKSGISVPKVFEIVEIEKQGGIVYERIYGNSLLDLWRNGKDKNNAMNIFVEVHKDLLKHHSEKLLSYRDYLKAVMYIYENTENFVNLFKECELNNLLDYKEYIASMELRNKAELDIMEELDSLPDGDCICHGDYHLNNVIIKPDGEAVIIDFTNLCHGPWIYDIARTFYFLGKGNSCMADEYLKKIDVSESDIIKYVSVIDKCRKYELYFNEKIRAI